VFSEKELEEYAEVLIWGLQTARRRKFKKNDVVAIPYHLPARKLAEILYDRLLRMRLNPVPRALVTPQMEKSLYVRATPRQSGEMKTSKLGMLRPERPSHFLFCPGVIVRSMVSDSM